METIPRLRRVLYLAIIVGCACALVEGVSLGLHPLLLGRAFSVRGVNDARQLAREPVVHSPRRAARPELFLAEDALHPYLGFIGNPADQGFSPLGFWGPLGWPPPQRDAQHVLVGIIGGSFAGQLAETAGKSLREHLSSIPRFAHREIVILDMAYGGWKEP